MFLSSGGRGIHDVTDAGATVTHLVSMAWDDVVRKRKGRDCHIHNVCLVKILKVEGEFWLDLITSL